MVVLYLAVRVLFPLSVFVLACSVLSRLINARLARLPRVPLNLPEPSSSPRRKDRRLHARALRRRPGLRTATRPATAPRRWQIAAACIAVSALVAAVAITPDGARFLVMARSLTGYPATVAEVRVPAAAHAVLLQAWQPVLSHLSRPVSMRYPVPRTGGTHEAHATLPVQVRHRPDALQIATAMPVEAEALRTELARLGGVPREAITVRQDEISPWMQPGWQPWPGR